MEHAITSQVAGERELAGDLRHGVRARRRLPDEVLPLAGADGRLHRHACDYTSVSRLLRLIVPLLVAVILVFYRLYRGAQRAAKDGPRPDDETNGARMRR